MARGKLGSCESPLEEDYFGEICFSIRCGFDDIVTSDVKIVISVEN